MRLDWMDRGACRGYKPAPGEPWPWDTDPITGVPRPQKVAAEAKRLATARRICAGCPVMDQCLDYGIQVDHEANYPEGIWGTLTPDERAEYQGLRIRFQSGSRRYAALCE